MTNPQPVAAVPVAASTVALVFADRFVAVQQPGRTTTPSYASGRAVAHTDLTRHLPVIALWSLRESGALGLAEYRERRLGFIPSSGVRAALHQHIPVGGIEGALLAGLAHHRAAEQGVDVHALVRGLIPVSDDPYAVLLGRAVDDAVAAGLLQLVHNEVGTVGRLLGRATRQVAPVPSGVAPLHAVATDLAGRFVAFRSAEPALYQALVKASDKGIRSRQRSDDRGPSGD